MTTCHIKNRDIRAILLKGREKGSGPNRRKNGGSAWYMLILQLLDINYAKKQGFRYHNTWTTCTNKFPTAQRTITYLLDWPLRLFMNFLNKELAMCSIHSVLLCKNHKRVDNFEICSLILVRRSSEVSLLSWLSGNALDCRPRDCEFDLSSQLKNKYCFSGKMLRCIRALRWAR